MPERPRQTWKCPAGCTWPECIHLCGERLRLVNASITSALVVVEVARALVRMKGHHPMRDATEDRLQEAIDKYDAACAAQREGP